MQKKYSVIIPHYNDYSRLERLLSSLPLHRKDIEALVIDDMSPEQEALELVMSRWPIVNWLKTPKNSGAGAARNVGLKHAKGEWLVFADSDDEFLPGAFDVFDTNVSSGDDIVYFLAQAVQELDGSNSARAERMNSLCMNYLESKSEQSLEELVLGHVYPVSKVYSTSFVKRCGVEFDEVRIHDDVAFNVLCAAQAKALRVVPETVYRIFRRPGSLMAQGDDRVSLLTGVQVAASVNRRLSMLGCHARMQVAGYLFRAFLSGPGTFVVVLRAAISGGLLMPTLRQLSLSRAIVFIRRYARDRHERKQNN